MYENETENSLCLFFLSRSFLHRRDYSPPFKTRRKSVVRVSSSRDPLLYTLVLYHRNEFAFVRLPARGTLVVVSVSRDRAIVFSFSCCFLLRLVIRRHQRFVMQTRVTRLGSPDRPRSLCIFCRLCSHPRCVATAIPAMTKTNILSATRLSAVLYVYTCVSELSVYILYLS